MSLRCLLFGHDWVVHTKGHRTTNYCLRCGETWVLTDNRDGVALHDVSNEVTEIDEP